jgi:hypothetical protein
MEKAVEKKSFFKRFYKKHHIFVGAGILAVMIVHFIIQTAFIQSEKMRSVESEMQSENVNFSEIIVEEQKTFAPPVEVKPKDFGIESEDFEAQKINEVKPAKEIKPIPRRQEREIADKSPVKKKVLRETKKETKAERLRRAEQILTGF